MRTCPPNDFSDYASLVQTDCVDSVDDGSIIDIELCAAGSPTAAGGQRVECSFDVFFSFIFFFLLSCFA